MEPIASGKSHARTSRPSAVHRKTRQPTTSIQYKRCSCTSHTGPSPMVVFTSTRTSICMFLLDSFELHFGDPTTLLTSTAQRAKREEGRLIFCCCPRRQVGGQAFRASIFMVLEVE